ncbi:MAG: HIT family protein [Marinilabiliales bacterium]|nr:MAG: HIT family protein [Marinilabiliales bacterium]
MSTVFSKIIRREIPAHIIAEDDNYIAFLDINPLSKGHTLVVPKMEIDYIFDLPQDILPGLFAFAQKVAKAIDKYSDAERIGIAVIGLEVPHAHVHLVPINGLFDIDFSKPKLMLNPEELDEITEKIRSYL